MSSSKRITHSRGVKKKAARRRNYKNCSAHKWRFENNKSASNAPQEILGLFPKTSSDTKSEGGTKWLKK